MYCNLGTRLEIWDLERRGFVLFVLCKNKGADKSYSDFCTFRSNM